MPLYRLVISLEPDPLGSSRGDSVCQQTHWVLCSNDDDAKECGRLLARHVWNPVEALSFVPLLWTCIRNANRVHKVVVEKWSNGEREKTLGGSYFSVIPLPSVGVNVDLPFVGASAKLVAAMPGTSRAITVELEAANGTTRRVYVGPISPLAIGFDISFAVVGSYGLALVAINSALLDIPGLPNDLPGSQGLPGLDYSADYWPTGFASFVGSWVLGVNDAYGEFGQAVVYSKGDTSPVTSFRASNLVAHMTSRASRGIWES